MHNHKIKRNNHDMSDHNSHNKSHKHMLDDFKNRLIFSLLITIPILLLSPMIQEFFGLSNRLKFSGSNYLLFAFATVIYLIGGFPFIKGLFKELSEKNPGMMTLIGFALTIAYFYSSLVVFGLDGRIFYWELATLVDVMLAGHWVEMRSVMNASSELKELVKLLPKNAHKIGENGETNDVEISELKKDNVVLVKPGEKIPVDGVIIEGKTYIDESMITGESEPVSKDVDNEVIGGSVNGESSIKIAVKRTGRDSYLSQLVDLVKEAQSGKSKTQNLANKAALWLTIMAISVGGITMLSWIIISSKSFEFALSRTVTVMVITCPHALGLAIPLVVAVITALLSRNGILIRDRDAFEKARNLRTVIFDKTGTLTEGVFQVAEIVSFSDQISKDKLIEYAASIESNSEHPIAKGIVEETDDYPDVKDFKAIPGKGAEGTVKNKNVKVVSPAYLKDHDIDTNKYQNSIDKILKNSKTQVFVLIENEPVGIISLDDHVRPESKEVITKLSEMQIDVIMITGDNHKIADRIAKQIGVKEYYAEVLPDEKVKKVKEIQKDGTVLTAMVGDGVNDAPALAQADVGIAIGSGTDVAAESADIILVKDNPLDVVKTIEASRKTYKKMVQNLIWAAGYNVVTIPLAAGVLYPLGILLSPAFGAALMSISTLIVAVNAKLLRI